MLAHPQLWPALWLSLFTGTCAVGLSLFLALVIVASLYESRWWRWLSPATGAFLAIPHLAFAIGFAFLIMPSGLIARLIALIFTGWDSPPQWVTTQDPWGLSLIASLVLKETPFLIWLIWSFLSRSDIAQSLAGQRRSARSLGHGPRAVWLYILLPQLLPRLFWPIVIVWVYGVTVVDMALVIGPTQPPTLAVIAWADLNDASTELNARGSVAAVLLTAALIAVALLAIGLFQLIKRPLRNVMVAGPVLKAAGSRNRQSYAGSLLFLASVIVYALVVAMLIVMSFAGPWPFPNLLPNAAQTSAWSQLGATPDPAVASFFFSATASIAAVVMAVLWLETLSSRFDHLLTIAAIAALAFPTLLLAGGQYALFLRLGLTGGALGLFLAHLMQVFAYVFIVLQGPYRAFDPRYKSVSLGLNTSKWRFWLAIKAPLLKPVLAAALAVGFAVGMAQYVPVQLVASGRFSTLALEAVTLSSGGNRPLMAVYALALTLPVALGFLLAARMASPKWRRAWA